jgi:hypothetical protein
VAWSLLSRPLKPPLAVRVASSNRPNGTAARLCRARRLRKLSGLDRQSRVRPRIPLTPAPLGAPAQRTLASVAGRAHPRNLTERRPQPADGPCLVPLQPVNAPGVDTRPDRPARRAHPRRRAPPHVHRTPAISCEAVPAVPRPRGHEAAPPSTPTLPSRPGAAESLVSFIALFGRSVLSGTHRFPIAVLVASQPRVDQRATL